MPYTNVIQLTETNSRMPVNPTRLLVINRQVQFSTKIKKTLEQVGGYEVASFTSAETAIEYLQAHPQHVALVDYNLKGTSGVELVMRLRDTQPDLGIILTPKLAATETAVRDFDLQGAVDTSISARELVGILQRAAVSARDNLPDTSAAAPLFEPDTRLMSPDTVQSQADPDDDSSDGSDHSDDVPGSPSVFEQLAAEEPPMPDLEENGTVHDLRTGVGTSAGVGDSDVKQVVEILRDNDQLVPAEPLHYEDGDDREGPILARQLLQEMSEPDGNLEAILSDISGTDDGERLSATGRIIEMAASAAEEMENLIPEQEEDVRAKRRDKSKPEPALPETEKPSPPAAVSVPHPETPQPVLDHPSIAEASRVPNTAIARLALTLTQESLELAADETLLTQDNQIVAYAGKLAPEDIEALTEAVEGDWDAQHGQSRIRFVNLPSSGKDYMLFSCLTGIQANWDSSQVDTSDNQDFTLTMVFSGNMPLQAIRRQSNRLLQALTSVPETAIPLDIPQVNLSIEPPTSTPDPVSDAATEVEIEPEFLPPVVNRYTGLTTPFTYVWLLDDSSLSLKDYAQSLMTGLDRWLNARGWEINTLSVHDSFIYLYAELPEDLPAYEGIEELKQVSSRIIAAKNPAIADKAEHIWSDAYLALLPGREMSADEIMRFVTLGRLTSGTQDS